MKPGELERSLARLVEVAKEAQAHLTAAEREAVNLRGELPASEEEGGRPARSLLALETQAGR